MTLSYKQNFLSLPSLAPAYALTERCKTADGCLPKLYWYAIHERFHEAEATDYLCFDQQNLVGMLNVFFFTENIEITVLIDPDFRRRGIFKTLLRIMLSKLRAYGFTSYVMNCHIKQASWNQYCQENGGTLDHIEYEMFAPTQIILSTEIPVLQLQRATLNDVKLLAEMHEQCFLKPNAEHMQQRFRETLPQTNRQIYLAKNAADEVIGKIHVREDAHRICLHDVGIVPAQQRKGYGKALMAAWHQQYAAQFSKPIVVEVLGDNAAAFQLYRACGFETVNTYHFWRFDI